MVDLPYLSGYDEELRARASELLVSGALAARLAARYPERHDVRSNRALHAYVQELKARHLRKAPPLERVTYDDKMRVVEGALGMHTTRTHTHGARTRKRRDVRVASLFKDVAPEFLRMIVVHELAHMKHAEHSRAFYALCESMEPDYHQLELDLRLHLTVEEWAKDVSAPQTGQEPTEP